MSTTDDATRVSVAVGPYVEPVLRRVVGMLAVRADLPIDRLDDALLVADQIASRAGAHAREDRVEVAVECEGHALTLHVGALRPGGAAALVDDAAVPGIGNVLERLADDLRTERDGDTEALVLRLAYAPAGSRA